MASLGWIFFSDDHRNRVGTVLDLLKAEGVVDELGLGTLRDGLANELFPGISTIQTRAKYFFIIPYILQEYEALKPAQRKSKSPFHFMGEQEDEVMWDLAEKYNHEDGHGVIGITKRRPVKLARRASAVYWNGLYTYQFINTRGLAAANFLKQAVNPSLESLLSEQTGDDGNNDDRDADHKSLFNVRVPRRSGWKENIMLDLEREEAGFFSDRIATIAGRKLIAELLKNEELLDVFNPAKDFMEFVKATENLTLGDFLRSTLVLAHDFSELMYGVHLAYNAQLQNRVFNNNHFDNDWKHWRKDLRANMMDYNRFDPARVFALSPRTRESTKQFVLSWWEMSRHGFLDEKKRDAMILEQEARVKQSKARLQWNRMEDVKEEKWIGLTHFDYRFRQGKIILNDITAGLNR
jgi:hypothetical protein